MKDDCLARTIKQAWELVDAFTKFKAVYERWKNVLSFISLGSSSNSLVEKCYGLKRLLDGITVFLDLQGLWDDDYDIDNLEGYEDDDSDKEEDHGE